MNSDIAKEALEKEKDALEKQLESVGVHNKAVPGDWITAQNTTPEEDPNLVADHTEEYDEKRATLAHLETRYNKVIAALNKIVSGNYGLCVVCQKPIEEDRLAVLPSAETCLTHKDN